MDHARKGDAALSASKYDEAVSAFTDALAVNPKAVRYYISRSTAYQRLQKYPEAFHDAEIAVVLAHQRATRELIKDAQFRRALALFFLERYGDAEYLFGVVKELDSKDKMVPIWTTKLAAKLEKLSDDDEKRKVTIKKVPDVEVPSASAPSDSAKSENKSTAKTEDPGVAPKPVVQTPANKIKIDWYQNNETVTINVLAKGVPKDAVTVSMTKNTASINFPIADLSEYDYTWVPLFAPIDPEQSSHRITPTKVEITLRKKVPGVKWHDLELEGDDEQEEQEGDEMPKTSIPSHVLKGKGKMQEESAPVYPTSSKSGTKNWDKVAIEQMDDKDEIEGDEASHFFKQLYKDASSEQQRAMMKSYQESGGTVLSTDWNNVGSRKVVPEPPEGMEAKKY